MGLIICSPLISNDFISELKVRDNIILRPRQLEAISITLKKVIAFPILAPLPSCLPKFTANIIHSQFLEPKFKPIGKLSVAQVISKYRLFILSHVPKLCMEFSQYVLRHFRITLFLFVELHKSSTLLLDLPELDELDLLAVSTNLLLSLFLLILLGYLLFLLLLFVVIRAIVI